MAGAIGNQGKRKVHYANAFRRPLLATGLGLTGTAAALPAGGALRIVGRDDHYPTRGMTYRMALFDPPLVV